MVDIDLIEELDAGSAKSGCITRVEPDVASTLVKRIADFYVENPGRLRWWESLKVPAERYSYGDADGLSRLVTLVGRHVDAILVVTDDEEQPWPVYTGTACDLIQALRGCRFFEYMLAAHDASWVIFDTHMNELLRVGRIPL